MALGPERHRDAAGFAWRALGLVVALRLSQGVSGSWAVPWTLYAGGIAAWIALGWKARWSGAAAAAVAVGIVAAGRLAYGLPAAVLWFVPVWAVFFGLPLLLRLRGGAHRAAAWLARRLGGLGPPLRAGVHWLGRYPRTREGLRIAAAGGAGLYAIGPFLHDGIMGGVDARWYTSVVADFLNQWRMGLGPVFVGQTYLAPLGTVMPLRVAPYLQHATLALDLVTGRRLSAYALLNLAVVASSVAGCVSAYLCLRAVLPGGASSSRISWNAPPVKSAILETAAGWRRRDLGDITTRGFRKARFTWRRRRWKYWAGVVTLATWMLSSAHACRKRSSLADECSGPWPS